MEQFDLEPADAVSVLLVVDNTVDMLLPGGPAVRRPNLRSAPLTTSDVFEGNVGFDRLTAEHGFAALVDITTRHGTRRLLFDAGISPRGVVDNLEKLQVALHSIEGIVLSHGHFDHIGGMDGIIKGLGSAALPVYVHPGVFTRRRLDIPGAGPLGLPTPSRGALEGAGFAVTDERRPRFVLDDSVLITGEVDRTQGFEIGMPPPHQAQQPDGQWQHDPLVLDDQALVVNVRGEGLLVISGCGHAGIVNTVTYAQRLTGQSKVKAIIGGFHLSGTYYDGVRQQVVDGVAALEPEVVMPGHCSGWKALAGLAQALPQATFASSVATRVEF